MGPAGRVRVATRLIRPSRVAGGPGPSVEVPMSGFEWVVHAGRTWQVCHEGPEFDSVSLGVAFDYGRINEGPADLGSLVLLANLLRAEALLARPARAIGPTDTHPGDQRPLLRGRRMGRIPG